MSNSNKLINKVIHLTIQKKKKKKEERGAPGGGKNPFDDEA